MKKFKFRLEALEKHRVMQEQEQRVKLSKAIAKMRATEAKLLDLDAREVAARREFAALGQREDKHKLARFWVLDQFIKGQKVRRTELKLQLQEDEQQVGYAYTEFLKARQQKKIMEKLHEKNLKDYKEKFKRYDLNNMDEQYTMRHRLNLKQEENEDESL